MPTTPRKTDTVAAKHAEAMDWAICQFCKRYRRCQPWFKSWRCSDCSAENMPSDRVAGMSDERGYYETIRRKATRARGRLAETLVQSRIATARDKRVKERERGATIRLSGRSGAN
jgi:hypothetical protein